MSDQNPSVNRYLKDKSFDLIDHALGRPAVPEADTYRNYFAIDADSDIARAFSVSPYWHTRGSRDGMTYFHVTKEGRAALAQHLHEIGDRTRLYAVTFDGYTSTVPAKSHGAANYVHYLNVSDLRCDLTFSNYCRSARVRLAPPPPASTTRERD